MGLDNTIVFFNEQLEETKSESEKKALNRFVVVLKDLNKKDLSVDEIKSIEQQIANLGIQAKVNNKGSYVNRRLAEFERYLQQQFKFRPVNYHRSFGIILGLSFGIALGFSIGSLFEGLFALIVSLIFTTIIGGSIGHLLGTKKDLAYAKDNRLYENK
ncbi:hypothetical protein [Saccharicrinis aurantiacus]|uniref:hypothetical protein n=1 Tax=Saccharicrinis aurantiacus TaxID=1849719 RepID=UPI002493A2A3|nr:hypothetical protein [Saccharicrinis aurantiacus]